MRPLSRILVAGVVTVAACQSEVTTDPRGSTIVDAPQSYQPPQNCQACHPRQYDETQQSVMSGYRAVSPLMNALELAGNFVAQGALEAGAIGNNLRPIYPTTEGEETNVLNSKPPESADQVRSAFCIGCHAPIAVMLGDDPARREIPEWQGVLEPPDANCVMTSTVACFQRIAGARPLRDYHLVDADGAQVLPDTPGGPPPAGAGPSVTAHGVSCDVCHNVQGAAFIRSLNGDGFANNALEYESSYIKIGPFDDALPAGPVPGLGEPNAFHESSTDPEKIDFLRSSEFCIACHDVRVPAGNVIAPEGDVPHFRLENLGTEWANQGYANAEQNPFGQVVRCQDCHMSLYPYGESATYDVTDSTTGDVISVTSPKPAVFPIGKAAGGDDPTGRGLALPDRPLVTHQFTGVDVPLLSDDEIRLRLGADRPVTNAEGMDKHGIPNSLARRRRDLLEAGIRIALDRTDDTATLGETFDVRVTALALTGHNFPSGFSQERTAWIELTVSAPDGTGTDFVLYQSGYLVDKPHPETGELTPDGSLDDEDLEHAIVVINPFNHNNEVFERGPDAGPLKRIFEGDAIGLVLLRNELVRIYGPEMIAGKPTGIPASNRRHPRTGEVLMHVLEEETFSAGVASGVDNWRGLEPLRPRTYRYAVELPSRQTLMELGIEITGPISVRAAVHFQHFPPLFLRFLARVSGSVPYQLPPSSMRVTGFNTALPGFAGAVGRRGPADHDFNLVDEARIDNHLRIVRDIATAAITVPVTP